MRGARDAALCGTAGVDASGLAAGEWHVVGVQRAPADAVRRWAARGGSPAGTPRCVAHHVMEADAGATRARAKAARHPTAPDVGQARARPGPARARHRAGRRLSRSEPLHAAVQRGIRHDAGTVSKGAGCTMITLYDCSTAPSPR